MRDTKQLYYQLKSSLEEGTRGKPEIYDFIDVNGKFRLSRREFIRRFIITTGVFLTLLTGCKVEKPKTVYSETENAVNVETIVWQTIQAVDSVTSVTFSPDGRLLAWGSVHSTVELWDVAKGKLVKTLEWQGGEVNSVAFSPDGRLLASGSNTIRLWDVATGKQIKTLVSEFPYDGLVYCVTFSSDGRLLASAINQYAVIWDVTTGKQIETLEALWEAMINSVAFSPDGNLLASGSNDTNVMLWDVAKGKLIKTLERPRGWTTAVAFSPDGRLLASGGDDGTIILWEIL